MEYVSKKVIALKMSVVLNMVFVQKEKLSVEKTTKQILLMIIADLII
jgi:hypothetical protein